MQSTQCSVCLAEMDGWVGVFEFRVRCVRPMNAYQAAKPTGWMGGWMSRYIGSIVSIYTSVRRALPILLQPLLIRFKLSAVSKLALPPTSSYSYPTIPPYNTLRTYRTHAMSGVEFGLAVAGLVGTAAVPMITSAISHYRKRQKKKRAMLRSGNGRGDSGALARTRHGCCKAARLARDYDDEWRKTDEVHLMEECYCGRVYRGADGRDERRSDYYSGVHVPPHPRWRSDSYYQRLIGVPDSWREWGGRDGASERGERRGRDRSGKVNEWGGWVHPNQVDGLGGWDGRGGWYDLRSRYGEEVDEAELCCCHFDEGCCLG